jgi:hypothetical protein
MNHKNTRQGWEPVDITQRVYNPNQRGHSIIVYDTAIADWLLSQPRDEWEFRPITGIATMTSRIYTLFLLKYSNNV